MNLESLHEYWQSGEWLYYYASCWTGLLSDMIYWWAVDHKESRRFVAEIEERRIEDRRKIAV